MVTDPFTFFCPPPPPPSNNLNWKLALAIGGLVGVVLSLVIACLCFGKKNKKEGENKDVVSQHNSQQEEPHIWAPPLQHSIWIHCEFPPPQPPSPPPFISVVADVARSLFWLAGQISRDVSVQNYPNE